MENTIVWRQISQFNKNLRWHNLICLALLLLLGGFQYRYLRNCFSGPQKIDSAQLLKISNVDEIDRDFITFTSEKAMDTGFQKVSKKRGSETTKNKYVIALVGGEKALLVEAQTNSDLNQPTFTGTLSKIDNDIQTNIVDPLVKDAPELQTRIMPIMLATDDYRFWAYFLVPTLIGGAAICSYNLINANKWTENPRKHPGYLALATYGEADIIATEIDREIRHQYNIESLKSDTPYLTPSWLIHTQTYGLKVIQLDRLMWVYKKVTSHSTNFIPTGKTYELLMHDNFGREHTLKMSEDRIHETIEQINNYAPWAVVGYSDEIKALWDRQRDDFYALVEEKKQESKQ
jgi:hypothetical protein